MDGTSRNRIRADIVTYCRNGEAMIRRRPLSPHSAILEARLEITKTLKINRTPATLLEIRPGNPVNGIESSSEVSLNFTKEEKKSGSRVNTSERVTAVDGGLIPRRPTFLTSGASGTR